MARNSQKELQESLWWRLLEFIKSLIFHRRKPGTADSVLFRLPECLVREIFELLSPVDQVCFFISCKLLFNLFNSTYKEFTFPRHLHIKIPHLCLNWPDIPRNMLLIRLENTRWVFCSACLKLHPRKEFDRLSLREPSLKRRCMVWAGIVDLCPCLSLTFRDREQLVQLLKNLLELRLLNLLQAAGECLLHECWVANDAYQTHIQMILYFSESDSENLIIKARYTIHITPPRYTPSNPDTEIFACPHIELLSFIELDREYDYCWTCESQIERHPESRPNTVFIDVIRPLGSSSWPADKKWFQQCRMITYLNYQIFWHRTQKFWIKLPKIKY
ncbi:hypothetical protein BGW36DRAFT_363120 [Talaromyces proteolyticus]|uniref:F-box domain-containing protein n=1 Tax=Talaromyces proteolyticus TaxID=1131652 RepID=A0AAD4KIW9_9EURO|nr:uncharacterized protein BGW36DRAFT_363120 [Talaromyces proteolyticus]KAH8692109.1 hypothetical protein BGW36DRAFT_363120 [Talaromyces proteolyticus]